MLNDPKCYTAFTSDLFFSILIRHYFSNPSLSISFYESFKHLFALRYNDLSLHPLLPVKFVLEHRDELNMMFVLMNNALLPQWLMRQAAFKALIL
jgi:hypothetical protein